VILDVGLCICVFDLMEFDEALLYAGDSAAHIKVIFRLVVFRPCIGEILLGKIKNCNDEGLHGDSETIRPSVDTVGS
jgi:DNA-directed RNA polymerase III subunit RPC8